MGVPLVRLDASSVNPASDRLAALRGSRGPVTCCCTSHSASRTPLAEIRPRLGRNSTELDAQDQASTASDESAHWPGAIEFSDRCANNPGRNNLANALKQ